MIVRCKKIRETDVVPPILFSISVKSISDLLQLTPDGACTAHHCGAYGTAGAQQVFTLHVHYLHGSLLIFFLIHSFYLLLLNHDLVSVVHIDTLHAGFAYDAATVK